MPKLYEIPVQFQLGQPVIPFAFKAHWQVHFNVVLSRNQSPIFAIIRIDLKQSVNF